jgi:hypothetical protein
MVNKLKMNKVIHTKTQEEYNQVMEIFEKKGWTWIGKTKFTDYNWDLYKEKTCIQYKNEFSFCNKKYYIKNDYEIISFNEFIQLEQPKKEGSFAWAVEMMKLGKKVNRKSYPDKDFYIYADGQTIRMRNYNHYSVGINSALATDWEIFNENTFGNFEVTNESIIRKKKNKSCMCNNTKKEREDLKAAIKRAEELQ